MSTSVMSEAEQAQKREEYYRRQRQRCNEAWEKLEASGPDFVGMWLEVWEEYAVEGHERFMGRIESVEWINHRPIFQIKDTHVVNANGYWVPDTTVPLKQPSGDLEHMTKPYVESGNGPVVFHFYCIKFEPMLHVPNFFVRHLPPEQAG